MAPLDALTGHGVRVVQRNTARDGVQAASRELDNPEDLERSGAVNKWL